MSTIELQVTDNTAEDVISVTLEDQDGLSASLTLDYIVNLNAVPETGGDIEADSIDEDSDWQTVEILV